MALEIKQGYIFTTFLLLESHQRANIEFPTIPMEGYKNLKDFFNFVKRSHEEAALYLYIKVGERGIMDIIDAYLPNQLPLKSFVSPLRAFLRYRMPI
jgi:hypothetical protein